MSSGRSRRARVPTPLALPALAFALGLPLGAIGAEASGPDEPEARPPSATDCSGRDGRDAVVGDGEDGRDGGDCGDDEPVEPS